MSAGKVVFLSAAEVRALLEAARQMAAVQDGTERHASGVRFDVLESAAARLRSRVGDIRSGRLVMAADLANRELEHLAGEMPAWNSRVRLRAWAAAKRVRRAVASFCEGSGT